MNHSLILSIQEAMQQYWDYPSLSDHQGSIYHYKDIARRIAKMHILFERCSIKHGDKIALCGRNTANWGMLFLATVSYGAVVVPILHEFKPDSIHHIVNHSDSRILCVSHSIWETLNEVEMPNLDLILQIDDFSILHAKDSNIIDVREQLNKLFGIKYPKNFRAEDLHFEAEKSPDDLVVLNYTSGTTGFSKGVMLPYRSIMSNCKFAGEKLTFQVGSKVICMLPMAHAYGMLFQFLYEFFIGCQVCFLTRLPTPKIILEAMSTLRPCVVIAVPMIIEKIYKKQILPEISKPLLKALLSLPVIDKAILKKIYNKMRHIFGDNFYEVIIGGAPFSHEAEKFFRKIGFEYTVGYGMTECGPIISYVDYKETRLGSCGVAAPRMEIKIDSPDPEKIVGEILVKGENVMLGYYKNPEATSTTLTPDGWMRTGDLGLMDKDGYLYIKGRSKNMILGPSGQNIYPEEIEDLVNNLPYVNESLIVERNGKLVALVFPEFETLEIAGLKVEDVMAKNKGIINDALPKYCQIYKFQVMPEEFEKTPKRSIKRFLYKN